MAAGEIAAAAGMAIYDGNEDAKDLWIRDNEILDQVATDRVAVRPIERGGTGGNTALAARTALGIRLAAVDNATIGDPGSIPVYSPGGQLTAVDPLASGHVVPLGYLNFRLGDLSAYMPRAGGDFSGDVGVPNLWIRNSFPAASNYTVCYINGDGRVSRGASAARFKKNIRTLPPEKLGDLFEPRLCEFQMRTDGVIPGGDPTYRVGNIADELEGTAAERFLVRDENGDPFSIDFLALDQARAYQLHAELTEARREIAELRELVGTLAAKIEGSNA